MQFLYFKCVLLTGLMGILLFTNVFSNFCIFLAISQTFMTPIDLVCSSLKKVTLSEIILREFPMFLLTISGAYPPYDIILKVSFLQLIYKIHHWRLPILSLTLKGPPWIQGLLSLLCFALSSLLFYICSAEQSNSIKNWLAQLFLFFFFQTFQANICHCFVVVAVALFHFHFGATCFNQKAQRETWNEATF